MKLVEAQGLVKVYPDGTRAVDGVSFTAGEGITVLMGPNGSGKTTTLLMVAGALRPTSGVVRVCGYDMWGGDRRRPRECIGFAPQDMPFREKLSARDNLVWYGLLRGLSLGEAGRRARGLLELVGLGDAGGKPVDKLSGGMRRRLAIAAALMGDPRVLLLDEPTSGLDPAGRDQLWRLLRSLARERAVIVSTHDPEEAEEYGDVVLIFHKGRIAAMGPPGELVRRHAPEAAIVVEGRIPEAVEVEGASLSSHTREYARYLTGDPEHVLPRLVEALVSRGAVVERISLAKPGLREVYYRVTGEELGA